jgi:hypothetical protein
VTTAHDINLFRKDPVGRVPEQCVRSPLLCTKTYDNPVVLARIPLRHLLVPIQNGFDPVLNELNHPFEGIASKT